MGTVSQTIAQKCIEHNGVYPGDEHLPPVVMIVEYDNAFGGQGYGLVYKDQPNYYIETEFVRNPRVYWIRSPEVLNAYF